MRDKHCRSSMSTWLQYQLNASSRSVLQVISLCAIVRLNQDHLPKKSNGTRFIQFTSKLVFNAMLVNFLFIHDVGTKSQPSLAFHFFQYFKTISVDVSKHANGKSFAVGCLRKFNFPGVLQVQGPSVSLLECKINYQFQMTCHDRFQYQTETYRSCKLLMFL